MCCRTVDHTYNWVFRVLRQFAKLRAWPRSNKRTQFVRGLGPSIKNKAHTRWA